MLCPSCGRENNGGFGKLCPACQAWIATRRQPDPVEVEGGPRIILSFVAYSTRRLRKARKFFDSVHWR